MRKAALGGRGRAQIREGWRVNRKTWYEKNGFYQCERCKSVWVRDGGVCQACKDNREYWDAWDGEEDREG
ncbi:hypothetical protein SAMN05421790_10255 [Kroppenstedtia eburnea]|uniref:Uncharacterized protein n=1 Tax=Kroppenstedtia eburnea TaxID=714067 RepID=A0A1N7JG62_9BACL|nr:hypothetical protein SAMN05421790_10255 [Kroppenstedtia eburnea]